MWFRRNTTRQDRKPVLRSNTIRGLLCGLLLGILVPMTGAVVSILILTVA